ncbi:MAG: PEP-CTERM sorting domain-containing protein [Microcystaceae cyanobacterium]
MVFGNNAITDNIFNIDNASFGVQAESQSTPEPSAVIALGLFGLGLGISKRVKRK